MLLRIFLVLLLSTSLACPALAEKSNGLREACFDLGDKLGEDSSKVRLGVYAFKSSDGSNRLLGNRIADFVGEALQDDWISPYEIVPRTDIEMLRNEYIEHREDSPEFDQLMRKKLNADLMLKGEVDVGPRKTVISAKIFSLDGKVRLVKSASVELETTPNIMRLHRTFPPSRIFGSRLENKAMSYLTSGSSAGYGSNTVPVELFKMENGQPVKFPPDQAVTYSPGDEGGFSVRPPMDSKLLVVNYSEGSDSAIVLYPVPQIKPRTFAGGADQIFPKCVDPNAVAYHFAPPYGHNVFKIIGVDAKVKFFDLTAGLDDSNGRYYVLDRKGLDGLMMRLKALPRTSWWQAESEFWIEEEIMNQQAGGEK